MAGRLVVMSRSAGWYPDPNDAKSEIYWDGSSWHGKRQKRPSTVEPHPVPPVSASSADEATPFTDRLAELWHGLSLTGRAVVIFGSIAVATVIGTLIAKPWESKFQEMCESEVADYGVSPTSPSFEGYVDICTKKFEEAEKLSKQ